MEKVGTMKKAIAGLLVLAALLSGGSMAWGGNANQTAPDQNQSGACNDEGCDNRPSGVTWE